METILITVNLQGRINGCVKHTTKQEVRVDISKPEDKFPKFINKKILHTDRGDSVCTKKLKIDESILKIWTNECPSWEKIGHWKVLSKNQRINSYVKRFDEGFGVTWQ